MTTKGNNRKHSQERKQMITNFGTHLDKGLSSVFCSRPVKRKEADIDPDLGKECLYHEVKKNVLTYAVVFMWLCKRDFIIYVCKIYILR
jgi:hypothetical protein